MVREEGAELGRPVREGEEDVGDEAGLFLHQEDLLAHVVGQAFEGGDGEAADRSRRRRCCRGGGGLGHGQLLNCRVCRRA